MSFSSRSYRPSSSYAPKRWCAVAAGAVALGLAAASPAAAEVTDYPVPTADAGLTDIALGRDGAVWFTEQKAKKIARLAPGGALREWDVPEDGEYGPEELTVASDGKVWFLSGAGDTVAWVDPSEPNPTVKGGQLSGNLRGDDIAAAPDGSVWITDSLGDGISRVVPGPNGPVLQETDGTGVDCSFDGVIAPGPDGRMWCAFQGDKLERIELDGRTTTSFPTPQGFAIQSVAAGPDGGVWYSRYSSGSWFTSPSMGAIGRMSVDGAVQEWDTGQPSAPDSLVAGPDGAVWFTTRGSGPGIGRITPGGAFNIGSLGVRRADALTFGPDNALWFVDTNANRVTRLTTDSVFPTPAPTGPGPTPKPVPAPAPKPTLPRVAASSLKVAKGRVGVRVSCPKTATARCRGTLRLRTASKVRVAGSKRKAVRTIASTGRYTLSPGRTGTVKVKLTATGRKVVRRGKTVKVSVQLTPTGAKAVGAKRTVRLKG